MSSIVSLHFQKPNRLGIVLAVGTSKGVIDIYTSFCDASFDDPIPVGFCRLVCFCNDIEYLSMRLQFHLGFRLETIVDWSFRLGSCNGIQRRLFAWKLSRVYFLESLTLDMKFLASAGQDCVIRLWKLGVLTRDRDCGSGSDQDISLDQKIIQIGPEEESESAVSYPSVTCFCCDKRFRW